MRPLNSRWSALRPLLGSVLLAALTGLFALGTAAQAADAPAKRPNIVLIVVDDMGFSDLGSYGSEISTPNLDALAMGGLRFTDFHTSLACSPSRVMLFTGVDNHIAGVGNMGEMMAPNQWGKPGYEGEMNHSVVSVAEVLKQAGYHTYYSGKWHLGQKPDGIPRARGYERDFTFLGADGSYFDDMTGMQAVAPLNTFTEDGKYLMHVHKGFFATSFYPQKLIEYIDSNKGDGKPFFAVLAHQAPHEPYGLPDEGWRRKNLGKYDLGWDELRKQRLARMKEMGIVPQNTNLASRLWLVPPHEVLAPMVKAVVGRKMELYAAIVENLDYETGKLIQHLKDIGEYDNTLFIFLSDNGAEGNDKEKLIAGTPGTRDYLFYAQKWSRTGPNAWGREGSMSAYGAPWAQVSMTPFKNFKGWSAEGGHHMPLVMGGGAVKARGGTINKSLTHIMDITPTILDLAGVEHPDSYEGHAVAPMQGKSLAPIVNGQAESARTDKDWLGWEIWGNKAIRQGNWKITWEHVPWGEDRWELYNLADDLAEQHDLAAQNPEKLNQMLALWDEYMKTNHLILPNRHPFEGFDEQLPPKFPVDEGFPPMLFKKSYVPPPEMVKDHE